MDNAVNETIQIMPSTIQAVNSPLQLLTMVIFMTFVVVILLVVSNIMDKKNKAIVDKEAAVRGANRDSKMQAQETAHNELRKDFEHHVDVDHSTIAREYKELRELVVELRILMATIREHFIVRTDINVKTEK